MPISFKQTVLDARATIARWHELCARHLPVATESIWRFSRVQAADDPDQGWKIHVSATIRSATNVLERIGPFLNQAGILFKAPGDLGELAKLNTGRFYGYTQIGKCFTIYPPHVDDCVKLAEELHALTPEFDAPIIPFDQRLKPKSSVFYRYGSFKRQRTRDENGTEIPAIHTPDGTLLPDSRLSAGDHLPWVTNPFLETNTVDATAKPETLLKTRFRVFKALSQRGKGGVYLAVDVSGTEPRLCVLKEGRKHGETCWDGRDGFWRIKEESKVLKSLGRLNVGVPGLIGSFRAGENFYLATEFIKGVSLERLLATRRRRLKVSHVAKYAIQLSRILSRLHSTGWVWRDCKPSNLMVSEKGTLRPVDFEGACRIGEHNPIPLGTIEFLPKDYEARMVQPAHPSTDLYALGVVIYYLLTGGFPSSTTTEGIMKVRKNIPVSMLSILVDLLNPDPHQRPSASVIAEKLEPELLRV
jgi:hypothetical protein